MTRAVLRMLLAVLAFGCATGAHAQLTSPTIGRLFTTPSERFQLNQQRAATPLAPAQATAGGVAPAGPGAPGMPAAGGGIDNATAAPPPPPPEPVRLTGVIRRGDGRGTVWINGAPQDARLPARADQGIDVPVPGGRVRMKPGQQYDPNDGAVRDAH